MVVNNQSYENIQSPKNGGQVISSRSHVLPPRCSIGLLRAPGLARHHDALREGHQLHTGGAQITGTTVDACCQARRVHWRRERADSAAERR